MKHRDGGVFHLAAAFVWVVTRDAGYARLSNMPTILDEARARGLSACRMLNVIRRLNTIALLSATFRYQRKAGSMNLGKAIIPDKLVEAARNGTLVVFVGAGVSMQGSEPIPGFIELVQTVSDAVDSTHRLGEFRYENKMTKCVRPNEEPCEMSCEKFLAMLESNGKDVRAEVARLCSSVVPSDLHRNLLRLFSSHKPRIVTTNFDKKFETAASELGVDTRVFSGPALPLGDSFEGIVHLHGIVDHPEELVLCDLDYGRAYISNGWASQFMVKMFSQYTVLFVGYRFSDYLVEYLTRSISAEMAGNVFAMVREDDEAQWTGRGITPVLYSGGYDSLPGIFDAWASRFTLSVFDKIQAILRITENETFTPAATEWLLEILSDKDENVRLAYIKELIKTAGGLRTAELLVSDGRKGFLLDELPNDADAAVRNLLMEACVLGNPWGLAELAVKSGGGLAASFVAQALVHISHKDAGDEHYAQWAVLARDVALPTSRMLEYAFLNILEKCESPNVAMAYIELLFQVCSTPRRDIYGQLRGHAEAVFKFRSCGSDGSLAEAILRHSDSLGYRLFNLCLQRLELVRSVETAYGMLQSTFDSLSYGRSAVEPHEQDRGRGEMADVVIDVARSCGERLLEREPDALDHIVERCISSSANIVRRLGLHLLTAFGQNADDALNMVLRRCNVDDHYLRHEVYCLLRRFYAKADKDVKRALVQDIEDRFPNLEDTSDAYPRFSLLTWLHMADPEDASLEARIQAVLDVHPYFEMREHPDLLSYSSVATWVDTETQCRLDETEFSRETLRGRYMAPSSPDNFTSSWERVAVPMKQHSVRAVNLLCEMLRDERDEVDDAIIAIGLSALDWQTAVQVDGELCLETVCSALAFRSLYPAAVEAADNIAELKGADGAVDHAALARLCREVFERWDFAIHEQVREGFGKDCDWLTAAINHACGRAIGLLAKLGRAAVGSDDGAAMSLVRDCLASVRAAPLPDGAANYMVYSALAVEINVWAEMNPDYVREDIVPALLATGERRSAMWKAISYLGRMSDTTWELTKQCWDALFKRGSSYPEIDMAHLACTYVYAAIMYETGIERSKRIVSCGLCTPEICGATMGQLTSWVEYLDDDERLREWDAWLGEAVCEFTGDAEYFERASYWLAKWLHKAGALVDKVAFLLAGHSDDKLKLDLLEERELPEIIRNMTTDENTKSQLIRFFLNNREYMFYEEMYTEALGLLALDRLSPQERCELRDACVIHGIGAPAGLM